MNRTQNVRGGEREKDLVRFVRTTVPHADLADRLEELYVLGDVIVHNHVCGASITWDDQTGLRLHSAELEAGYGDRKFEKVLDRAERRTRQLQLNLFPTTDLQS